MLQLRWIPSRRAALLIVVGMLLGAALATAAWMYSERRHTITIPTSGPNSIRIRTFDDAGKPLASYDLEESMAVRTAASIFMPGAGRETPTPDERVRRSARYTVSFSPGRSAQGHFETVAIWRDGDRIGWTAADRSYLLFGDLEAFLDTLPTRRFLQLAAGRDDDRETAEQLLQAGRGPRIEPLLAQLSSPNPELQVDALYFLARWIGSDANSDYFPIAQQNRRATSWVLTVEQVSTVRKAVLKYIEAKLDETPLPDSNLHFRRLSHAIACMRGVGDDATADTMIEWLNKRDDFVAMEEVMSCVAYLDGIPGKYLRAGICGNSSAEEIARFDEEQDRLIRAAREDLVSWHTAHPAAGREARLDAVLERWRDTLRQLRMPPFYEFKFQSTLRNSIRPLLKIGPGLVPAIRRRQAAAIDLSEKGGLEFVAAAITGRSDQDFVKQLLAGDGRLQQKACYILALCGEARRDELVPLLRVPSSDLAVREAATMALVALEGPAVLPILEAARDAGFQNDLAERVLKHYTTPSRW